MKALHDIIKIHNQGNILIVSHGHTLRLLLALLNGATWKITVMKINQYRSLTPQLVLYIMTTRTVFALIK